MTAKRESCSRQASGRRPSWKLRWRRRHGQSLRAPAVPARHGPPAAGAARAAARYVVTRRGVLYLLDVYAKSAKEDLTDAEKHQIRKLVAAIEAET
jgi:hypothetical protein